MAAQSEVSHTAAQWIDNRRVDSQAMLSAYMAQVRPGDKLYGLTIYVHRMPDYVTGELHLPACVTPVPCATPSCFRCSVMQGGYIFRWFHPLWMDAYLQLKRRDQWVWTPGETDEETTRFDAIFQTHAAAHEMMMRAKMASFHAQVAAAGGLRQHLHAFMSELTCERHRRNSHQ